MSNKKRALIDGPFTAVRHEAWDSLAWRQLSAGARLLYIALTRQLNFTTRNNGRLFLSTRDAAEELGVSHRAVWTWYRELEHYGFIVSTQPGTAFPGGKATYYRLTDWAYGTVDGKSVSATKDYLKWDGTLFERRRKNRIAVEPNAQSCRTKDNTPVEPISTLGAEIGHSPVEPNATYLESSPSPSEAEALQDWQRNSRTAAERLEPIKQDLRGMPRDMSAA